MLPDILWDLELDPYAKSLYWLLKKIAGDKGACFMSNERMAAMVGCGVTKLRSCFTKLESNFEILGNKPLIRVQRDQFNALGEQIPNHTTIMDIWDSNFENIYLKKSFGARVARGECSRGEHKEDTYNNKEGSKETASLEMNLESPAEVDPLSDLFESAMKSAAARDKSVKAKQKEKLEDKPLKEVLAVLSDPASPLVFPPSSPSKLACVANDWDKEISLEEIADRLGSEKLVNLLLQRIDWRGMYFVFHETLGQEQTQKVYNFKSLYLTRLATYLINMLSRYK